MFFRKELILRGNNTNNPAEAQSLVLKSSIRNRTKEFNSDQFEMGDVNIVEMVPQLELLDAVVVTNEKKRSKAKKVNKEFKRKMASEIVSGNIPQSSDSMFCLLLSRLCLNIGHEDSASLSDPRCVPFL